MVSKKEHEKLWEKLSAQIAFGTAGLRGEMGAGFALMNDVTVLQTTQVKHKAHKVPKHKTQTQTKSYRDFATTCSISTYKTMAL